jgi:cation:H+ antiporter
LVIATLILGLVLLTIGAELLVRGASRLAVSFGISPLVVGLTVVSFGTSAPELVVCLRSTLAGQSDVALGNIVGSNICNVLLILGISAVIIPLRVAQQLIRFDVPLMIGVSFLVGLFALDGRIGRLEGLVLATGLTCYMLWAIVQSRREGAEILTEYEAEFGGKMSDPRRSGRIWNFVQLLAGLGLLLFGSRLLIDSAIEIAQRLGVSELVIGLTIVAVGTSLPEVATSIMAAARGERDIAVGNVVGSNLFNLMGVLGISSLVAPEGVAVSDAALQLDIPIMIAVAVACLPIFFTGHLIARWEGGLFLAYFCAYQASFAIAATAPHLTRTFGFAIFGIVVPLTVITLATGVVRHLSGENGSGERDTDRDENRPSPAED